MSTVTYNPFEPGFTDDPYPTYDELRRAAPVQQTPLGPWILFRYEDVNRFLRDPSLSVDATRAHATLLDEIEVEAIGEIRRDPGTNMLNADPPDHTRLRRLVSKAFTPRMIERLRARVVELVDQSLDRAADAGHLDLIGDLAFPLPFQVITEMLGMPDTDALQLREWTGLMVQSLEPVVDPATIRAIADAGYAFQGHLDEAIAWKRSHPADDLLTGLIAAEEDGDALSDAELASQVALLYIAGHETTVNLIGNGTLALLRHPDQMQRWRDDPELGVTAVDELLRYDTPVQNSRRVVLTETEVGGQTIEAGAFTVLCLASANRDPEQWGADADQVDLTRADANQHVSFGGGHHYCLGAALARLEGQVALGGLVQRFATIEPTAEPRWNGRINLRGLAELPLLVAP